MSDAELAKQLQGLLSEKKNDQDIISFFQRLDVRVEEFARSSDQDQRKHSFKDVLEDIYHKDVDPSNLHHVSIFLELLYHCRRLFTAEAFISDWFELILRPALREPKLATVHVEHAKELIVSSLESTDEPTEKSLGFRRRLVDLFLLDAYNESSGKDILDWADMDETQREKGMWWKQNLQDILLRFGIESTKEFLDVLDINFQRPDHRLQILNVLDNLSCHESFFDISGQVISHDLTLSILRSLEIDNSSTLCTLALSVIFKPLVAAAIKDYDKLKEVLPRLLGILGRMLCWKPLRRQRGPNDVTYQDLLDLEDKLRIEELEGRELQDVLKDAKKDGYRNLKMREELHWEQLGHSFDVTLTSVPNPRRFFAVLYCLFPCNTVKFLRKPLDYLKEHNVHSPWTVGWEEALDELQIRSAGASLLRTYSTNPLMVTHDAESELADHERFASQDFDGLIGDTMLLDWNTIISAHQDSPFPYESSKPYATISPPFSEATTPRARTMEIGGSISGLTRPRRVSLQDIIATNVALKSGNEITTTDRPSSLASALITPRSGSPLVRSLPLPIPIEEERAVPPRPTSGTGGMSTIEEDALPAQIVATISSLQREVLLLRTEINFELFLKRSNIRHICRLHEDQVVRRNAEVERQRLHDRLRDYRTQLSEEHNKFERHKKEAAAMKKNTEERNSSLQNRLNEFRAREKSWSSEEASLKEKYATLEAVAKAQEELLAKANKQKFDLETEIKQDKHKVQRLRDYENRIDQLTKMLRLWDEDVKKYNELSQCMQRVVGEHQKMKISIESHEKSQEKMAEEARANQARIVSLEAQLRTVKSRDTTAMKPRVEELLNASAAEKATLTKKYEVARQKNEVLQEEVEELNAMVEMLKSQVKGTTGLVYPAGEKSSKLQV